VLSNAVPLLVAGHETTVNLITNGMLTLLRHPQVLDRLRPGDDPDLAARVVGELLRYEPPVQYLPNRNALDDIEIAGTIIPRGSLVNLVLAAGSRDPDVIPEPDRFDPDREHDELMGFGGGVHYCFGAPLARPGTRQSHPSHPEIDGHRSHQDVVAMDRVDLWGRRPHHEADSLDRHTDPTGVSPGAAQGHGHGTVKGHGHGTNGRSVRGAPSDGGP
jgi:Cytochrome P450